MAQVILVICSALIVPIFSKIDSNQFIFVDFHDHGYVELTCEYYVKLYIVYQSKIIGAKFQLNGTDINEAIDECEDWPDNNGTVSFLLTEEREGKFTCSYNGLFSKNTVTLPGIILNTTVQCIVLLSIYK